MSAIVAFDRVTYRIGEKQVLDGLDLEIETGETLVLLGRSGSGKTTALRMVNALAAPTSGKVLVEGRSTTEWDPIRLRRRTGYVIQEIGLFPHFTVARNVGLAPRLAGMDPSEIGPRYPAQLSGGQRQRVGVARALAADPPLMLMDEPFGAIDPINRARLQDEFLSLQQRVRKPVVFVTHDVDEAIKVGDKIAILRQGGHLAQYASPEEILTNPADQFVAEFVGADRALKRLGLATLAQLELLPADGASADGSSLTLTATVRDALSGILGAGGRPVTVLGEHGEIAGVVTLELLGGVLADGALATTEADAAR